MLALSTELARSPWSESFACHAEARSAVCGSTIMLGLDQDAYGAVSKIGLKVSACAVGQSSAAILASGVRGASISDLDAVHQGLKTWLHKEGELPNWPRLGAVAGALDHPGRHGAILLPWEAALKALSSAQ